MSRAGWPTAPLDKSASRHTAAKKISSAVHCACFLAFFAGLAPDGARAADAFTDALFGGKLDFMMRYRFEDVIQANKTHTARANTLRTRLGYMTGALYGVSLYGQVEDVHVLGSESFNDTINKRTQYPTIADPRDTKINQAFIQYQSPFDTLARVGRQRITFDDQRWIGDVGFRQNEQTFDAVELANTSFKDLTLDYVFVNKVHRIFTDRSVAGLFPMKSHLFRAEYKGLGFATLTGYSYLLDFTRSTDRSLSTATTGARLAGSYAIDPDWKLLYAAEYARQVSYADNPKSFGLDYYLIEPGVAYGVAEARLGYEVLGSDGTNAVQTPLATGHLFQGWADLFLTTPAGGIDDLYISAKAPVHGVKLAAIWHNFDADKGGAHYGQEFDAIASYRLPGPYLSHFTLDLIYANYQADGFAVDTQKYWASVTLKY